MVNTMTDFLSALGSFLTSELSRSNKIQPISSLSHFTQLCLKITHLCDNLTPELNRYGVITAPKQSLRFPLVPNELNDLKALQCERRSSVTYEKYKLTEKILSCCMWCDSKGRKFRTNHECRKTSDSLTSPFSLAFLQHPI